MSQVPEITQTLTGYPLMEIIKNVLHGNEQTVAPQAATSIPTTAVPYVNQDEV
jgi:hypothetical protein